MSIIADIEAGLKKFFDFLVGAEPIAVQALQIAAQFIPGGALPAAAITIASKLPSIVADVEVAMTGAPGPMKKAAAMTAAKQVVDTVDSMSEGGQKGTWDKVSTVVSTMTDTLVAQANAANGTVTAIAPVSGPGGVSPQ